MKTDCSSLHRQLNLIHDHVTSRHPGNKTRATKVASMLGQRRRRWTSIQTALGERIVFAKKTMFTRNWFYAGPTP